MQSYYRSILLTLLQSALFLALAKTDIVIPLLELVCVTPAGMDPAALIAILTITVLSAMFVCNLF